MSTWKGEGLEREVFASAQHCFKLPTFNSKVFCPDICTSFEPKLLRLVKMTMVSEFLGQLTLNVGTEPKYPTVLPFRDFDPDKDAARIETAIKTKGVDEQTIIDILTKGPTLKEETLHFVQKRNTQRCCRRHSGNFAKLLLALVEVCKRAEPTVMVDNEKIDQDARALYESGVKIKVFNRYKSYSPYDMQESIRKEVKGDLQNSFLVLVQCIENKQLFFASRLQEAMKGKGAKEKVLTRIIVSRCEVDLGKICNEYKAHFGQSLQQAISEHTKGDYQKALLSLCGPEE
ncbi:hypothetical protein WMY93_023511 [Mugilogobius chulae]|uniref:Annexin n=1 Tax=Mugilogobius chulae TaxID=88201 RepID=A0AAW0NEZ8_9GOBI